MKLLITVFFLLLTTIPSVQAAEKAPDKNVVLQERTAVTLYVLPTNGVRLIFPFKLDNPSLDPVFEITGSSNAFTLPEKDELIDASSLAIRPNYSSAPDGLGFLTNLFIDVNGYYITVNLFATNEIKKHSDNVFFTLGKDDRKHLIEASIAHETELLSAAYNEKVRRLDEEAKRRSLSVFADSFFSNYDEEALLLEGEFTFSDGSFLVVYLDDIVHFNISGIYIVSIELKNITGTSFSVKSFSLSVNDQELEGEISTSCKGITIRNDSMEKCSIVTRDPKIQNGERYEITVSTPRGDATTTLK